MVPTPYEKEVVWLDPIRCTRVKPESLRWHLRGIVSSSSSFLDGAKWISSISEMDQMLGTVMAFRCLDLRYTVDKRNPVGNGLNPILDLLTTLRQLRVPFAYTMVKSET